MELKIGDYVRTINGKIWIITSQKAISGHKKDIIKSSPRIIDLIEVGDYVNGCMVVNKNDDTIQIIQIIIPFDLKENDIKNIVTKQQFESMQYVVKEN